MSRLKYTPIVPTEARAASRLNTIWSDFTTAGNAVNYENFAEEGMDARPFVAFPHAKIVAQVSDGTRVAASLAATGGAYALYVQNAVNFQTGALTVTANDVLHIHARVVLESQPANWGLSPGQTFGLRLRANGAVLLGKSKREHMRPAGTTVNNHLVIETQAWVDSFSPTSIELLYRLTAGGAWPSIAQLTCTLLQQVN